MAKLTIELVRRNFPEVRESWGKHGEEFNVHCPFSHKKGGVYKLYINAESGMYFCQDCGRKGNAWREFFEYAVARRYGNLEILRESQATRPAVSTGRGHFFAGRGKAIRWGTKEVVAPGETVGLETLPEDHPARVYLRTIRQPPYPEEETCDPQHPFHCLYCTKGQVEVLSGKCRAEGRLIFPLTQGGDVIGWTARTIEKEDENGPDDIKLVWDGSKWEEHRRLPNGKWDDYLIPKWFHLPSMSKSTVLFNYDAARDFVGVVLVEGPFDVLRVGEFAVGYLGNIPSEVQLRMIKNSWETVFWMPDKDVNRESRQVGRVMESLSDCCRTILLDVPGGAGDPGKASRDDINSMIQSYL